MEKIKYYLKSEFSDKWKKEVFNVNTLVDIGCGIMPALYIKAKFHICVEPFKDYAKELQNQVSNNISFKDRNWIILNTDFKNFLSMIPDYSVDSIIMVDVIEHIQKNEVLELIKLIHKKVLKQIIIITPLGFMPQEHENGVDAWGMQGGDFQKHLSGWTPEDFIDDRWRFIICEDYHTHDNLGNKLESSYGRLCAIFEQSQLTPKSRNHIPRFLISLINGSPTLKKYARLIRNLANGKL